MTFYSCLILYEDLIHFTALALAILVFVFLLFNDHFRTVLKKKLGVVVREVSKNALDYLDAPVKDGITLILQTVTELDFSYRSFGEFFDKIFHRLQVSFFK